MSSNDLFSYSEKRGFFQRYGLALGLGGIIAVVGIILFKVISGGSGGPPPRNSDMVMLSPLPPPPQKPTPPPPPPDPVQNSTPQQETNEQPMLAEEKPAEAPAAEAPEGLGTNLTGSGGPDYGLSHSGNGMIGGTGKGGNGGGSRFGWYSAQVQRLIADALRENPVTRLAQFNIKVRIWPDTNGRITRAKLASSTGDSSIDQAITDQILKNFQLQEPPPQGMPLPIVMRFNARRPN